MVLSVCNLRISPGGAELKIINTNEDEIGTIYSDRRGSRMLYIYDMKLLIELGNNEFLGKVILMPVAL